MTRESQTCTLFPIQQKSHEPNGQAPPQGSEIYKAEYRQRRNAINIAIRLNRFILESKEYKQYRRVWYRWKGNN